jgi:hypothetical protein
MSNEKQQMASKVIRDKIFETMKTIGNNLDKEIQQSALTKLINIFKENITFLESSLDCCNDELIKIVLKVRLSQARYFLTYAIEAKEMEKEQIIGAANNGCKGMCMIDASRDGKQYYNETYGGNK